MSSARNAAHVQPVERLHPHEAAHLIRAQHLIQRLRAGSPSSCKLPTIFFDAVLSLDGDFSAFQQAGHIGRAVGSDFHHAAQVLLFSFSGSPISPPTAASAISRHSSISERSRNEPSLRRKYFCVRAARAEYRRPPARVRRFRSFPTAARRPACAACRQKNAALCGGHLPELVGAVDFRILLIL